MEMPFPSLEEGGQTLTVLLIAAIALFVGLSFVVVLAMKCSLAWSGAGSHGWMRCSGIVFLSTAVSMATNIGLVFSGVSNPLITFFASLAAWLLVVQMMTGCGIGSGLIAYLLNCILTVLGVGTVSVATVAVAIAVIPAEEKDRLAEKISQMGETQLSASMMDSFNPASLSGSSQWEETESTLAPPALNAGWSDMALPNSTSLTPTTKSTTTSPPRGVQSNPFVK